MTSTNDMLKNLHTLKGVEAKQPSQGFEEVALPSNVSMEALVQSCLTRKDSFDLQPGS